MSVRCISVNPGDLSVKRVQNRKTKRSTQLTEPVTINTTNIRKLLLEKLKQHKKTKKNIVLSNSLFGSSELQQLPMQQLPMQQPMQQLPMQQLPMQQPMQQLPIQQLPMQQPIQQLPMQQPMQQLPIQQLPIQQLPIQQLPMQAPTNEPQYSNLKQGTKPTYKEWIQTNPDTIPFGASNNNPFIQEREIKKTYNLGKNIKNKTISILIKSNKTRKNVDNTKNELKKTKLNTVKNYLKGQNLIKFGTTAPSGLLKEIYESTQLCGEIYNNNANTLLHNYNINSES